MRIFQSSPRRYGKNFGTLGTFLFPTGNRLRKFKGNTRHYNNSCPWCKGKFKNINYHMKKYHYKEFTKVINSQMKAISTGQIGEIHGVRIVSSFDIKNGIAEMRKG